MTNQSSDFDLGLHDPTYIAIHVGASYWCLQEIRDGQAQALQRQRERIVLPIFPRSTHASLHPFILVS
jgi:hypothetical protein